MKTKDRLKEEIGFDKLIMTIAAAMFSSLAGWLFTNRGFLLCRNHLYFLQHH